MTSLDKFHFFHMKTGEMATAFRLVPDNRCCSKTQVTESKRSLHDCLSPSAQCPVSIDIITVSQTQTGNAGVVVYIIVSWKPIRLSFICCSLQVLMKSWPLELQRGTPSQLAPPLLADLHESYSWRVAWPPSWVPSRDGDSRASEPLRLATPNVHDPLKNLPGAWIKLIGILILSIP